jgi:hypothetical protein
LDYGSLVYFSAQPSYRKRLLPIQNQALRLCTGAFCTSPEESLQAISYTMTLGHRANKLALQYALIFKSNTKNPAHDPVFHPRFVDYYHKNPNAIPPYALPIRDHPT